MAQMHTVFLSHAHADNLLCDRYVAALRERGLDVWYDRTNMQAGHSLTSDIEVELRRRTAFVVMATPASLASQWVRSEIAAFRYLAAKDPTRLFLPVRAAECEMPLLWVDILWIDAVSLGFDAAVDAMATALGALAIPTPQPNQSVDERLARGIDLWAKKKYAEDIPFFERGTQLDPSSFYDWANLGVAYTDAGRQEDGLTAYDCALALDDKQAWVWFNKGTALADLERYEEALVAYDQALALDPSYATAWVSKGYALRALGLVAEAKEAEQRARELGYKL